MWLLLATMLGPSAEAAEGLDGLETALRDVQKQFPVEVASEAVYRAALEGVAAHLDALTGTKGNRVMTQGELDAHTRWMEGHRSGIGAEFTIVQGRGLMITEVFESGPAQAAGLEAGDVVISIDQRPLTGLSSAAIHARVVQTSAEVSVFDVRRASGGVRKLSIARGAYKRPVVQSMSGREHTPIAWVPFFGNGTADALAEWLKEHKSADAVVLDLRDNEGGSLDEVVRTADLFLDRGAIVVNRGHLGGTLEPVTASSEASWLREVVLLVNQGTAGAAEAFAAALRDNGRGVLVGTRTGGRAVDSSVYDVGRGFVMKVADIQLTSPSGTSWARAGLEPNVVVKATEVTLSVGDLEPPQDLQRDTALHMISGVN